MVPDAMVATLLSPAQFLAHPAAVERSELVRGEVRMMTPAGGPHGTVCSNLHGLLWDYVRRHALGRCYTDGTGFALPQLPDTVRSPDVAYVRAGQLPPAGVGPGFLALAPDLAVEVLSPSETASDVEEKLADYRAAGTSLVWLVDPVKRLVSVIAADAPVRWLREGDTLEGGRVVPGFACPVAVLFDGLAPPGASPGASPGL